MKRALAAGLLLALASCRTDPQPPPRSHPNLFLLTGLPLAFGESFTLAAPPSPVLATLERRYRVTLIDGPEQLPAGGLLLAAQPRALTAARLVQLDRWVRGGGRLLLLADPRLTWPSELPLEDRRRPPYTFADTGLLEHWGLALEAPETSGPALRTLAGREVEAGTPGSLHVVGGGCTAADGGFTADCRLGRGRAIVVADADFLGVGIAGGLDGPTEQNLPALMALLRTLAAIR